MKQTIKNYGIIIFSILFLTFLASLILTILDLNSLMQINTSILTYSISYILYAITSFIFGIKIGKKGLLNGIILFILLFFISLIINSNISLLHTSIKFVIIAFFSVLGVNKKNS